LPFAIAALESSDAARLPKCSTRQVCTVTACRYTPPAKHTRGPRSVPRRGSGASCRAVRMSPGPHGGNRVRRFLRVQRTATRNGRGWRNVWVEVEGDQLVTAHTRIQTSRDALSPPATNRQQNCAARVVGAAGETVQPIRIRLRPFHAQRSGSDRQPGSSGNTPQEHTRSWRQRQPHTRRTRRSANPLVKISRKPDQMRQLKWPDTQVP